MGIAEVMAAHAEPPGTTPKRESQLNPTLTKKMLLLFIVGDILGGGIYARTGEVAGEIGGAIWTGVAGAAGRAAVTGPSYAAPRAAVPLCPRRPVRRSPPPARRPPLLHPQGLQGAAADLRRRLRGDVLRP